MWNRYRQRCSPQQPDVIQFPCFSLTGILCLIDAFVVGWSKEFHSKERLHLLINYNRDRHTCINPSSKKLGTYVYRRSIWPEGIFKHCLQSCWELVITLVSIIWKYFIIWYLRSFLSRRHYRASVICTSRIVVKFWKLKSYISDKRTLKTTANPLYEFKNKIKQIKPNEEI